MILVDHRVGSRELLSLLRSLGCDAELTELDGADFAFTGNGDPQDCAAPFIGIERKKISEFCESMRSRRLAGHQHVKMSRLYEVSYIFIEGPWRRNRDNGYAEVPAGRGMPWKSIRGSIKHSEIDRFICSLEIQGGMHVWRTADEEETAAAVANRYLWWSKPWHEHTAMQTIYAPGEVAVRRGHKPSMVRRESTLCEKVVSQLPGVDSKAVVVAQHFQKMAELNEDGSSLGSVERMVIASAAEWQKVEGIGKIGAKRIVEALNGTA